MARSLLRRPEILVALLLGGSVVPLSAALPANFADTLVTPLASPTAMAFTPDGRLLLTQQTGALRVYQGGTLLATPALTFSSGNICTDVERGLLGVAVDPNFSNNQFIYLYYTFNKFHNGCPANSPQSPVNRVSRFLLPAGNAIDPATEVVLLDNMKSPNGNHNGGDLKFGRDGNLYVTIGDGGCDYAGDSGCAGANDASRDQNVLTGKVLRITPDGGIPADNPFQGAGTGRCSGTGSTAPGNRCQETFAWGLRNPFRIAMDPNAAGTRFFIDDTGQDAWEEIDLAAGGSDYGWNCREGRHTNSTTGKCSPTPPGMVDPIFEYAHNATVPGTSSSGCNAITGGAFVPNGRWPGFDGLYLFTDYICGSIFKLADAGGGTFAASDFVTGLGGGSAVDLLFGPPGSAESLYYTTYAGGGQVRRISFTPPAGNHAPAAVAGGAPLSGPLPLAVTFSASGSSDADAGDTLTYFWDFGDGSPESSTASLSIGHTYPAPGVYTVSLRARDNHFAFSPAATVQVEAGTGPFDFHTLAVCRLIDTRNPAGPLGGPALASGAVRTFTATGACGIPAAARALAANVTIVAPSGGGFLQLFPGGGATPATSALNFGAGQTRSNNSVVLLGAAGDLAAHPVVTGGGAVHLVLDVVGWFE